jgi:hypothetical protein
MTLRGQQKAGATDLPLDYLAKTGRSLYDIKKNNLKFGWLKMLASGESPKEAPFLDCNGQGCRIISAYRTTRSLGTIEVAGQQEDDRFLWKRPKDCVIGGLEPMKI